MQRGATDGACRHASIVWEGCEFFDAEEWHDIDMHIVETTDGTRWILPTPLSLALETIIRTWVAVVIHPRVRCLSEW